LISDPEANPIQHLIRAGTIHIGLPGDVAGGLSGQGDGSINIVDVVKVIQYILGNLPPPDSFGLFGADMNGTGTLDVRDVVAMINAILSGEAQQQTKVTPEILTDTAVISLGPSQTLPDGRLAIPVNMSADGPIAGLEAHFIFDPIHLEVGHPYLADNIAGMTVQSRVMNGTLRLVDQVQAPGHYRVVWHGRNGQGQAVASGVYVYRLTSSTGFTDTRRMTLLK